MSASTHAGLHSHGASSLSSGWWGLGYAYFGMSHEKQSDGAASATASATVDVTLVTDVPLEDVRYYTSNFNEQSILASNLASGTHTLRLTFAETRNPPSNGYENWTYSSLNLIAYPAAVPEPSTWVMGAVGIACAGWGTYRRRKRA